MLIKGFFDKVFYLQDNIETPFLKQLPLLKYFSNITLSVHLKSSVLCYVRYHKYLSYIAKVI